MVQKPERGRFLTLEGVRVSYKPKDDTIHLTSTDPDIPNGSFYLTLNKGTSTEDALREVLYEHGLIKEITSSEPIELVTVTDQNPLVQLLFEGMSWDDPAKIAIEGKPGTGTASLTKQAVYTAQKLGLPMTIFSGQNDYNKFGQDGGFERQELKNLPLGFLNPFQLFNNETELRNFIYQVLLLTTNRTDSLSDFDGSLLYNYLSQTVEFVRNNYPNPTIKMVFDAMSDGLNVESFFEKNRDALKPMVQPLKHIDYDSFVFYLLNGWDDSEPETDRKQVVYYDVSSLYLNVSDEEPSERERMDDFVLSALLLKEYRRILSRDHLQQQHVIVMDTLAHPGLRYTFREYNNITRMARSKNIALISTHITIPKELRATGVSDVFSFNPLKDEKGWTLKANEFYWHSKGTVKLVRAPFPVGLVKHYL